MDPIIEIKNNRYGYFIHITVIAVLMAVFYWVWITPTIGQDSLAKEVLLNGDKAFMQPHNNILTIYILLIIHYCIVRTTALPFLSI